VGTSGLSGVGLNLTAAATAAATPNFIADGLATAHHKLATIIVSFDLNN
jgi:hypothetical protein